MEFLLRFGQNRWNQFQSIFHTVPIVGVGLTVGISGC